ncbi:Rpn family recombination-promoting nuclease/putative transposase [Desnuesiella massiliensis]|uniref:Rpn family recombination-promoting nuclease/putative transposase n=1 Tax=Desnuesiella massiliensis TaxID=1650662 RepID=UPI00093ADA3D|nr:Rpn family recombination-promoting nuclease/putative transposase [Desnuesiella massiliensis]
MKIKREIHNIHDKSYKDLFSNKEILATMVQSFVKSSWKEEITKDNIELVNKSYILSDYEELESDVVYKANIDNKEVIFYILLEFQSYVDYSMPIRLFLYMSEIWREVLRNSERSQVRSKDFKLPAIVPIVLYNGEYKWTVEKKFKNVINKSELFGNNIIDFEYILIDINKYEKEELMELGNIASAIFLLDQKVDIEEFIERVKDIALDFNNLNEEQKMLIRHWLRNTLSEEIKDKIGEGIENILIANKEEVNIMTSNISKTIKETFEKAREEGIEEGREQGREQGREEGIEQGELNKAVQIAKNLLSMGVDVLTVIKATGLSKEDIEKIKEGMN